MFSKSKLNTALATTIIAACMLSGATAARADFITFTLKNVTFDDGGSATGTITYDPTGCGCDVSALAITTTDGSLAPVLSGGTYGDVLHVVLSPNQTRFDFLAFETNPNVLQLFVQGNPLSSTTPSPFETRK